MHDGDLRPQGAEEVGQLSGDVFPSHDSEPPRLLWQSKRLVGGDIRGIAQAGDLWDSGPGTRGDDHGLGTDPVAAHLQGFLAHESTGVFVDGNVWGLPVPVFDGLGIGVDLVRGAPDDELPVHRLNAGLDSEQPRPFDSLHHVGGVDEYLGWDASAVQAGPAKRTLFHHGY